MKMRFILGICMTLIAAPAFAQLEAGQHVCREEDLVPHTFKLVQFEETPALRETSYYQHFPYQYLSFYVDSNYGFLASDRELTTPAEVRRAMRWPEENKRTVPYTLSPDGELDLKLDKTVKYRYRCVAIEKDQGDYKKGDLIMNGYTRNNRSTLYKVYRRWY